MANHRVEMKDKNTQQIFISSDNIMAPEGRKYLGSYQEQSKGGRKSSKWRMRQGGGVKGSHEKLDRLATCRKVENEA